MASLQDARVFKWYVDQGFYPRLLNLMPLALVTLCLINEIHMQGVVVADVGVNGQERKRKQLRQILAELL